MTATLASTDDTGEKGAFVTSNGGTLMINSTTITGGRGGTGGAGTDGGQGGHGVRVADGIHARARDLGRPRVVQLAALAERVDRHGNATFRDRVQLDLRELVPVGPVLNEDTALHRDVPFFVEAGLAGSYCGTGGVAARSAFSIERTGYLNSGGPPKPCWYSTSELIKSGSAMGLPSLVAISV
ncbi:hypothetical protein OAF58_00315 [bacterium]|nr:hypothetical protein [bacterium]